ncbi:ABC transporter permease [Erwinia billingiae]|uniref:ABC transporter permease n=1 Tax=Erwinia billingiae TaxID=182337 RepID=UPI001244CD19|nr:ABC transporter permease [Erwinia billingiae]QEW31534.1 ABC transporter permease [Erwinia billingiae]
MKGFVSTPHSQTTLREVYESRGLIFEFVRRDFNVRYKQTSLGILWAIINPGVNILLYLFVFGLLVKVPTPEYNAPYAAVLISGILFWNLFAGSMMASSDAIINNMHLLTKVYFPRISLCIASVFVSLIDFFIAFVVFIPLAISYDVNLDFARLIFLVPCILITLMLGCGLGCFMAILKLKYRDLRHVMPLLTQALFFASPVVYTLTIVPEKFHIYYALNPLTGIVSLSRWALLGGDVIEVNTLIYSLLSAAVLMFLGIFYFIKNDRLVADYE